MFVEVTDVFLRDGLQDEHVIVPTAHKLQIAQLLQEAGIPRIEATSFVNPARVPQMADAPELFAGRPPTAVPWIALALNGRGVDRAIDAGAREVAVVASASTGHSAANAGKSTDAALDDLAQALQRHRGDGVRFVAGISTAFVCPFEGDVPAARVAELAQRFAQMGVTMIGLADTLGSATPDHVLATTGQVRSAVAGVDWSLHLHNAHGRALETVLAAVDDGITRFDAALGGYGGCPFAPGAAGNLDTLSLVEHLHAAGHTTGIDTDLLAEVTTHARHAVAASPALAS